MGKSDIKDTILINSDNIYIYIYIYINVYIYILYIIMGLHRHILN